MRTTLRRDARRLRGLRGTGRSLARRLVDEVKKDRLPGLAAETAFFAVLSLFPALLIAVSLLDLLDVVVGADVAVQTERRVTGALDLILTGQASEAIRSVESVFQDSYGGLLTFATVAGLVTLSGAWAVLVGALNEAYDTTERRTWLRRRLLGLGLGLVTVVIVVVALTVLVVGPLLGRGEELADLVGLGDVFVFVWNLLRLPLLFAVVTAWVMFVYRYAPNRRTRWRDALPGALTTSSLWLLATAGFHLYLRISGERNPVLGAFGGGAIIMIWVYLLSLALLLGGELNAVIQAHEEETGGPTTSGQDAGRGKSGVGG